MNFKKFFRRATSESPSPSSHAIPAEFCRQAVCGKMITPSTALWTRCHEYSARLPAAAQSYWILRTSSSRVQLLRFSGGFDALDYVIDAEGGSSIIRAVPIPEILIASLRKRFLPLLGPELDYSGVDPVECSAARLGGSSFFVCQESPGRESRPMVWSSSYLLRDEDLAEARYEQCLEFVSFWSQYVEYASGKESDA